MKVSGINWIRDIGDEFILYRLKHLLARPLLYGASESGIPYDKMLPRYVRITDITSDGRLKETDKLSLSHDAASGYILSDNDILFARSGATVGKAFLYKKEYGPCAFAGYLIKASLNQSLILPDFLFYYTQCSAYEEWKKQIFVQATIQNIGADKYSELHIPVPSLIKQHRIIDFLKEKCGEIDNVIKKTKESIEEYRKIKQSIITKAVTKGIRDNRTMKDSGIEWVGEIPEEWESRRIKTLFTIRDEKNYLPLKDVNLISLYTDKGVVQHSDLEETTGNKASTAEGYKIVEQNDIIVNIILAWMGAIGRSDYSGVTSPAYDIYIPQKFTDSKFYHYYFRTKGFSGDCFKRGRGIMMMRWRTYSDDFMDIKVPYPSLKEQKDIVAYLNQRCSDIDSLIVAKQNFIKELESYKKSLIYEYVTGKKEVPHE